LDLAIIDFDKAIQLNPDLALAYNNRGIAYPDNGKAGNAIADFKKSLGAMKNQR
jgi:tetratricopeptide (TPR) repeat protein